ncbi:MAG: SIS domain-containing protein [Halioglobus sp.]|nr:SIS domain-containing protein [Halioglobus sp.]
MDHYERIARHCQDTIESIAMSVDQLAGPLEEAAALMTTALLADGKIIACGNGADAALAQLFVCQLLGRFEQERPALPALSLASDGAAVTAVTQHGGVNDAFARQLRALGQPGDVLLCINSAEGGGNLLRAVQAAMERNMAVVLLTNTDDGELGSLMRAEDAVLRIQAARTGQRIELFTLVLNCCSELIDQTLFGDHGTE